MTLTVTHRKVSSVPTTDDSNLVSSQQWNDTHVIGGTVDPSGITPIAANALLANPTGGIAAPIATTLGATLAFVGGLALQTLAGTGDVAWSANSFVTTIQPAAVSYAKIQNVGSARLLGNPTGAPATTSEITLGATLAFVSGALQTIAQTGDVTTSANSFATTIAANAVTNTKFRQSAARSVVGNATSGTANVADIVGTTDQILRIDTSGTTLNFGAINLAAVAAVGTSVLNPANGGSGRATLTANAVILGAGTGAVNFATIGTAGRLLIDKGAGLDPAFTAMTGDAQINGSGSLTINATVVTYAKLQNVGASSLVGNATGVPTSATNISLQSSLAFSGTAVGVATAGVTYAMIQNVAASRLLGNPTGGATAVSEITLGATLTFSGTALQTTAHTSDVTSPANSNVMTIAANVVDNTKLAQVATARFKARVTAGTGNVEDLTGTQATTLLDVFTSVLKGLVPASGGGTTNFLRADGTFAAPPTAIVSSVFGRTGAVVLTGAEMGYGSPALINGTFVASVAASALTVAIKTLAGADPSAGDPVYVVFRNATLATGDYVVRTLTAANSHVINSTSTLGTANSVPFRLWITAHDNAGTVRLGFINCLIGAATPTHIFPLDDSLLVSTTGGSASSAGIFYTSTDTLSSKAFRIVGYLEYSAGLATAGTWASVPTKMQIFGPGIKKPGDTIQKRYFNTSTTTTTTNTTDTVTATTDTITPTSTSNPILIDLQSRGGVNDNGNAVVMSLLRGGATAVGNPQTLTGAPSSSNSLRFGVGFTCLDAPNSTSSQTYALYIRSNTAAQTAAGGPSHMTLTELMT